MKVLNLYAGIGGNRKLWKDVEVTAVENNESIAEVYQDFFPDDIVIVADAHQYLLDHYKEFDFIWSSPPCQSHTRMRVNFSNKIPVIYADMALYQEVILLINFFKGKYCVENVIPYYEPLMIAQQIDRHLYWCNFKINQTSKKTPLKENNMISQKTKRKRKNYDGEIVNMKIKDGVFDLSGYDLDNRKDQILRNCVRPEDGLYILNCARNIITKSTHQSELF